ncbi:MAG: ClbS/DfsB family four-helix bundle protein [Anaerolineales bacterium]|nr:ClbS/DfsB family four-helix bundle protein [Anaerolineales bacterium]
MEYKHKLLELVAKARQSELSFIAELGEEERAKSGTFQEWSAKDEMVHIGAWKGIMCERFRAFQADQTPPAFDDWDAVNAEVFDRHKDDSWSDAVDYLDLSYQQMVEQIQAISEDDLVDGQRYPWLRGRSLFRHTIHNGYFHPHGHVAFWYSKRGDTERGNYLMEEVTNQMQSLDESPAWRGQTIYNLACYYALNADKEQAIDRLGQAFGLSSDLVAWSMEDSDLTSIWDEPGYLALVEQWKST